MGGEEGLGWTGGKPAEAGGGGLRGQKGVGLGRELGGWVEVGEAGKGLFRSWFVCTSIYLRTLYTSHLIHSSGFRLIPFFRFGFRFRPSLLDLFSSPLDLLACTIASSHSFPIRLAPERKGSWVIRSDA